MMKRREFITLLGGAAAWPFAARAEQAKPMVGFVSGGSPGPFAYLVRAFRQGLNETGYVEGQNLAIEFRWAEGRYERLPELVTDLIRREASVLAATTTPGVLAAKAATTTIPIVFATDGDPVQLGLTGSLSRPGGNITGVTNLNVEVAPKRVELAHELNPAATVIALLVNRPIPLQTPLRGTRKQPLTLSGCSSMYSMPPPTAILMRFSKPSCNCAPRRWSSPAAIRFSAAGPSSSVCWRCITGCPRSSSFARLLRPVA
jgi:ABC transporter substrate binding protein